MSFYAEKVCECRGPTFSAFKYDSANYEMLDRLLADEYDGHMPYPPTCARCKKWFRYNTNCEDCGEEFFSWFHHKRARLDRRQCWNCIVESDNDIHPILSRRKTLKPHPETLPPGYKLAEYQIPAALSSAVAAALASFNSYDDDDDEE